jgi:hypothetical protein
MTEANYLSIIAIFSLVYVVLTFASFSGKLKRMKRFLEIMQPTLHLSMAMVALSGLKLIA